MKAAADTEGVRGNPDTPIFLSLFDSHEKHKTASGIAAGFGYVDFRAFCGYVPLPL